MLLLRSVEFPKAALDAAPEGDRTFFLMSAQLMNEAHILSRQALFAFNYEADAPDWRKHAQLTMAMLNIRLLASRLFEGWSLFGSLEDAYPRYAAKMTAEAREAQAVLTTYFANKRNLARLIRNRLGFHADTKLMRSTYADLPDDRYIDYLSQHRGNTLFFGAELVQLNALIALVGARDGQEAMDIARDNILGLHRSFNTAAEAICLEFYDTYLRPFNADIVYEDLRIDDAPDISQVVLPYFTDTANVAPA